MRRLAALAVLVAASCASPSGGTVVVRSDFTARAGLVGAGAIVRSQRPVVDVELSVSFYRDGKRVRVERDRIPFCPRSTDCPWAQQTLDESLGEIDRIEVLVTGAKPVASTPTVHVLRVRTTGRGTTVMPAGIEGTVYLVAFDSQVPTLGRSFFVRDGERDPLHFSEMLFPRRREERVVAYLYPGPVPARVGGPAD